MKSTISPPCELVKICSPETTWRNLPGWFADTMESVRTPGIPRVFAEYLAKSPFVWLFLLAAAKRDKLKRIGKALCAEPTATLRFSAAYFRNIGWYALMKRVSNIIERIITTTNRNGRTLVPMLKTGLRRSWSSL